MVAVYKDVPVLWGALACLDAAGCEDAEVYEDAAVCPDDGIFLKASIHHR